MRRIVAVAVLVAATLTGACGPTRHEAETLYCDGPTVAGSICWVETDVWYE